MSASATGQDSFRKRFVRQIAIPITLVMAIVGGAAFFGLKSAATQSDAMSVERQLRATERALNASVDEVSFEQQSLASWPDFIEQINRPVLNVEWFDENVGYMGLEAYNVNQSYILNENAEPVYASIEGHPARPESFEAIRATLMPMVRLAQGQRQGAWRSGPHDRLPGQPLAADATVLTSADTIHASGLAAISGRPAAVTVMRVKYPSNWMGPRVGAGNFLLVAVRFLDGANLRGIAEQNLIDGLRSSLTPNARAGEQMIAVNDNHGGKVGYFFWHPELPGTKLLRRLAPIGLLGFAACALVMAWLARSLWRSGSKLDDAMVELLASRAQAQHLAFHDILTGLPNRALFDDRLDQALAAAYRGRRIALLALDLDRFKNVNDTLGHSAGDQLIREFADRLSAVLRPMDTVARIGGDEFVVILSDIEDQRDVESCCLRILEIVRHPFEIFGNQIFVGVSVGVAMTPEAGLDRSELIRKADIALYRAKADGRERHCFFTPSMDEAVKFRSIVEDELRHAISGGEQLVVHYQPQVNPDGAIVGLEALVRWNHPVHGSIPPAQFIPIAEETGVICILGEWIMAEAFRVAREWPHLFVAVNLSPMQFRTNGFPQRVIALAGEAGCNPRQIELEVTEGVLVDDDEQCRKALETLRGAGFRIALDDFGTGYSSLSYLRKFQVDKIKIDQSFTKSLGDTLESGAIVSSVVTLGHAMGLSVAAEGVETPDQMKFLSDIGCNEFQGFLFSHAVAKEDLRQLIATYNDMKHDVSPPPAADRRTRDFRPRRSPALADRDASSPGRSRTSR